MQEQQYDVVVNIEEQFSIWPCGKELPGGWERVGVSGGKEHCLDHISRVWVDMRPKSLRMAMQQRDIASG
jgi:MbtH protein